MDESDEGNGGASETTDVSFLDGRMIFSAGRYTFSAFTARFRFRLFLIFGAGFVPKPPDDAEAPALSSELLAARVRCFFDADFTLHGKALKANAYLSAKSAIRDGRNISSAIKTPQPSPYYI